MRPYRRQILVALTLGVLLALFSTLLPVIASLLIKSFEGKNLWDDPNDIMKWFLNYFKIPTGHWIFELDHKKVVVFAAFALPVYYLIYGLLRYAHFYLVKYTGEKVIADIRIALMDKFMEQDVMYLGRQQKGSGGLLSRTLNDTLILQQGFQFYADLVREPLMGVVLISYLFYTNWQITLGCFFFIPVFASVIRYVSKSLKNFGYQSQESLEEVTKILKEGLDGVRVIQSFNLQDKMKDKFRQQIKHYLDKRRKIIKREELGSPINEFIAALLMCGVCLFQAQLIWGGKSDVSDFIAFLVAAGMLDKPVKKTQQAMISVQQNIVALDRLYEVLNSRVEVQEPALPRDFPAQWDAVHFKNVSFSYNKKPVLQNINLKIKKGEVVAIVGESGSGKSTLAGLMQRFFDPQEGEVCIGDTPIQNLRTKDLRKNIGFVTQDVFLFDDTVENNIWFGNLERDKRDVSKAARMANATRFVEENSEGFQALVGERGARFSGGEKQRISIARAVFKDPPILILDEATSALDSASELEVQKGIETLLQGRTALVIAHRLSTIINCDRILVMKEGRIIEEGTHKELLQAGAEYARFFRLQYSHSEA